MATKDEVSFAGERLADLRKRRGLTAVQLAELVPGGGVSGTMITNLESGRKRDMTVTEAVVLAWALDVSPLELMIDTSTPWAPVPFSGIANEFHDLSTIEYARLSVIYPSHRSSVWWGIEAGALDYLVAAEDWMIVWRNRELVTSMNEGERRLAEAPGGRQVVLRRVEAATFWEQVEQRMIDMYRDCLWELKNLAGSGREVPAAFHLRLDAVRRAVVEVLATNPVDLDYGQTDSYGILLNPSTGRPIRRERDQGYGAPTDPAE